MEVPTDDWGLILPSYRSPVMSSSRLSAKFKLLNGLKKNSFEFAKSKITRSKEFIRKRKQRKIRQGFQKCLKNLIRKATHKFNISTSFLFV